jgi:hypothetical protein
MVGKGYKCRNLQTNQRKVKTPETVEKSRFSGVFRIFFGMLFLVETTELEAVI